MNESTANSTFAKALRSERKRMELTQAQLADRIGTSQQNIAGMEKGLSLPRPDLHDRMVDLFGSDSVIAALPPKRDLLLATEAIGKASATAALETISQVKGFDYAREVLPSRVVTSADWRRAAAIDPKATREALREVLPVEYHQYIDGWVLSPENQRIPGVGYRADYLSPGLCVEMKRVFMGHRLLEVVRLGIQQISLFRNILESKERVESLHPQHRRYVLALVVDSLDTLITGRQMNRASYEAAMCQVEIHFCNHPTAVAHTILMIEKGTEEESEEHDSY